MSISFIAWRVAHHRTSSISEDPASISGRAESDIKRWGTAGTAESGIAITAPGGNTSSLLIPVGTLVIEDITGQPLHQAIVPIVDAGWIALPMPLSLGGYRWQLWMDPGNSVSIEGGVFRDFDRIGIWQMTLPPPATGPPLAPWDEAAPLHWYSLHTDEGVHKVSLKGCEALGYLIQCDVPHGISGPGVLIQNDSVVGWTFEARADGAFLWNGLAGADLTPEIRVDDYYRQTFAESREEKWLQALAADGRDNLQRLDALLDAYRYPRKLTDGQLPPNLDPLRMVALLQNLVADLAAVGQGGEVVNRFDRQILLEIDDPDLVIQLAGLTGQTYGNEDAINTIEWVKDYLSLDSVQRERFYGTYREFYVRLLNELAMQADWASAAQKLSAALTEFPDDPQLHLFEIRLAIANGNWYEAERLLASRTFPESYAAMVVELQSEIGDLKASDGKVVVRFRPGSRNIRVTAELNGQLAQPFLIDTGATTVTIPTSTARRLGIPFGDGSTRRTVSTAGGPVAAHEVTIDDITVGGWRVQQVTALVLDIPGQSNIGLLGMNYLRRFDMDLQVEKGLLILSPK